jgi:hypothetical protein
MSWYSGGPTMKPRDGVSFVIGVPHRIIAIIPDVPPVPVSAKLVSLFTTPMSVAKSRRSDSASCRLERSVSRESALFLK